MSATPPPTSRQGRRISSPGRANYLGNTLSDQRSRALGAVARKGTMELKTKAAILHE
jgi:hypothetical protein